jgi:hypothetical protein
LGGFGGTAGVVRLVAFVGDAFAVQGRVLKQVESLRRESEFVLRDMQAASGSFHGGCSFSD